LDEIPERELRDTPSIFVIEGLYPLYRHVALDEIPERELREIFPTLSLTHSTNLFHACCIGRNPRKGIERTRQGTGLP
jgi:hypothetical protein